MPSFSVLTNVMQHGHVRVLERWLDFLAAPPACLVVSIPDDGKISDGLHALARSRNLDIRTDVLGASESIADDETTILRRQFEASDSDYCLVIRLDTVVFRDGGDAWLPELLGMLEADPNHVFATGITRPYRDDRPMADRRFHATRRVSNNFMIVRPGWWLETQQRYLEHARSRFYVEWSVEERCREEDLRGIRCLNRPDWRILHAHVWDERLETIQQSFEAGMGLKPFLHGFEDDARYAWERYYLHPRPSWPRRLRITAGRVRRNLIEGLLPARRR